MAPGAQRPTHREDTAAETLQRPFRPPFSFLAKSQAMQMYQIDPSKRLTVKALLDCYFPAIQSTQDQPTPYVAARTIGYIHANVTRSLSTTSLRIIPVQYQYLRIPGPISCFLISGET